MRRRPILITGQASRSSATAPRRWCLPSRAPRRRAIEPSRSDFEPDGTSGDSEIATNKGGWARSRSNPERERVHPWIVSFPASSGPSGERGLLSEARILWAAIVGGVLVAPVAAHAQQPPAQDQAILDDEPIVSDSAFEEAWPPLDPELSTPLEPIEGPEPDPSPV